MDRIELCRKNYTALFGGEALTGTGTDPELMDILQKYIFGEVFAVGDLDLKTRELITCTVLSVMQTCPSSKPMQQQLSRWVSRPSNCVRQSISAHRLSVFRRH
ncbi:MAG: carboxymuconolactone decarboxylase family protein [Alistipes indistinctus]